MIDTIKNIAEVIELTNGNTVTATQLLTRFNFPPAKQYDFTGKLSGGEKRRLQLLKVLMGNPNFLILDEPTNDLDLITLNTLEDYLEKFSGCLVIVSHDRYFIDRLVDHLFVFDGQGNIRDIPGNFTDYRLSQTEAKQPAAVKEVKAAGKKHRTTVRKLSYNEKREFAALEEEIAGLEKEKAGLMVLLSQPTDDYQQLAAWGQQLTALKDTLAAKENRWLELAERNG